MVESQPILATRHTMSNTTYIISMEVQGIPYYLHNNGKFYNAFVYSDHKTYKTLNGAQKKAHQISALRPDTSVRVLSVKEGELLRKAKTVALYENVRYTDQMSESQLEMYGNLIKTLTPAQIHLGARRGSEKPMGYLLTYIRDMGMPKTSGWLVAEAILARFGIDNENCPWLNNS